jgi:hypothetical protein
MKFAKCTDPHIQCEDPWIAQALQLDDFLPNVFTNRKDKFASEYLQVKYHA